MHKFGKDLYANLTKFVKDIYIYIDAHMVDKKVNAKTVEVVVYVNMEESEGYAKTAEEVPFVSMVD